MLLLQGILAMGGCRTKWLLILRWKAYRLPVFVGNLRSRLQGYQVWMSGHLFSSLGWHLLRGETLHCCIDLFVIGLENRFAEWRSPMKIACSMGAVRLPLPRWL